MWLSKSARREFNLRFRTLLARSASAPPAMPSVRYPRLYFFSHPPSVRNVPAKPRWQGRSSSDNNKCRRDWHENGVRACLLHINTCVHGPSSFEPKLVSLSSTSCCREGGRGFETRIDRLLIRTSGKQPSSVFPRGHPPSATEPRNGLMTASSQSWEDWKYGTGERGRRL